MRRVVRRLWPKVVSVVLTVALLMLVPATTLAASNGPVIKINETAVQVDPTLARHVATLAKYISFANDGRILFDAQGALKAGVPKEIVEEVKRDYDRYNESLGSSFTTTPTTAAACLGVSKFVWRTYGVSWDAYFNSCDTNRIVGLMTAGAGLTAIAGAVAAALGISSATALLVASGLLTVGVGIIIYVSANGCGFVIRDGIFEAPRVWGQC